LDQRFTRSEVERMTGATRRQLNYWARLGLVHPRARWGERFFGFSDLVAVETIRRVTERQVPAGRLRRAMEAIGLRLGETRAALSSLRIAVEGSQIIVHEPGSQGRLLEPISGQFLLNFEAAPERKVHALGGRSAEQWFEMGMAWDSTPGTLPQAADAYRSAIELSPAWVEAHINLGTALYQLGRMEESRDVFRRATVLDPRNALGHFNLGCMHDRLGDAHAAIEEFRAAIGNSPHMADAHLNLALAYEKSQRASESLQHLSLYLRYEPQGPWADFARMRLRESRGEDSSKVTPFRRLRN
jgi:tetratricopeptide (TPR) repeat protein